MSFADEQEAFQTYAQAMPNNCVFLVDTYDTLEGVKKAIKTGHWLREQGHEMVGVRLDSGDLAALSRAARVLLDEAGFPKAAIIASNDLDEYAIQELKARDAKICIWGVGTKLATAYEQPALGGVYKLGAIQDTAGAWQYRLKLSNDAIKVSNPGMLQLKRLYQQGQPVADVLWNQLVEAPAQQQVALIQEAVQEDWPEHDSHEDLLNPVFEQGVLVYEKPSLNEIRAYAQQQLALFARVDVSYSVALSSDLYTLKQDLIQAMQTQSQS